MLSRLPLPAPSRRAIALAWTLLLCFILLQPGRDPLIGPAAAGDHDAFGLLLLHLAHLLSFALMTWLWWRALGSIRPALLIALTCGGLTEVGQIFVPDRGLSALDLALNGGGALAVALWLRRRESRAVRRAA
ncbi:MAG: hypothetical protein OXB89_06760 [Anaerolineaceae bacterium]|nr:hypothetical protein [Anaerolineaceae bacterium]